MRRLFTILAVVVILSTVAPAALADNEPNAPEQLSLLGYTAWEPLWWADNFDPYATILGEVWEYAFWMTTPPHPVTGVRELAPFHPVDIWLWRPPTMDIFGNPVWPLNKVPAPAPGFWYLPEVSSSLRRQTWPAYAGTDEVGFYYAKFMIPRNAADTWFPCGFPCRWECNYWDPMTGVWEIHAPNVIAPVYRIPLDDPNAIFWPYFYPLYWPDLGGGFLWPGPDWDLWWGDTIHPLTAWPIEGEFDSLLAFCDAIDPDPLVIGDEFYDCDVDGNGFDFDTEAYWEYVAFGYFWKTTDLEMNWPADWPLLCPWQ